MKRALAGGLVLVILLHQDFWLAKNATLLFGFLPAGLAYHMAYTGLAALAMAALVRWAWPRELEDEDRPAP